MGFFKGLARHPIWVIVVILVAAGIYLKIWQSPTSKHASQETASTTPTANATRAAAPSVAPATTAAVPAAPLATTTTTIKTPPTAPATNTAHAPAPAPSVSPKAAAPTPSVTKAPPFAATTSTAPAASATHAQAPALSASPQAAAPTPSVAKAPPIAAATSTAPTQTTAPTTPVAKPSNQTLLTSARKAFWMHDAKAAEADYRALIAREPNKPELHGELGNVLYASGQREAAGKQYAKAVAGFIARGELAQARGLMPVVAALAPSRVAALAKTLESKSSPPKAKAASAQPKPFDAAQRELLMQARKAYWQHDLKTAEADYRKLIREVPDAPAPYGELGNLLLMRGQKEAAAKEYGKAAQALIALGRYREAAAMRPLIGSLNPKLATRLERSLASKRAERSQ